MLKNIVVTGACGQIGYSLLFMLAGGALMKGKFHLKLLDLPSNREQLEGLKMELEDTASPYIGDVSLHIDPNEAFQDGDIFFFLGAFPRGPGMERRDLLEKNAKIFIEQGTALKKARKGAKIVVVGNPCNTNAYILKKISKREDILITSMSMLDHLRAKGFISKTLGISVENIKNLIIWGNHSKSLYVDTHYIETDKGSAFESLEAMNREKELQSFTQKRGEVVIKARGKSSAASAANAALMHMKALLYPTTEMFSCGVYTGKNPYGLDPDLFFSMPCILDASGELKVLFHFQIKDYAHHLEASLKELQEERDVVLKSL